MSTLLDDAKRIEKWCARRNGFIENFKHDRYRLSPIVYPNVNGRFPMVTLVFNEKGKRVARIFWKTNI